MKAYLLASLATLSSFAEAIVTIPAEECEYSYLTQRTDHYGQHNGTFQQRYSVNDTFFKPGGPILMFQGEETDRLDCANNTILYEWAQELNGLAVSLEHRYFGESAPFGDASNENENRVYLTLDNVMADAVEFVEQLRANISGAGTRKAMVASGSYGGFLAAAFRLNRPETFEAALASAGPVMGFGGAEDPESYNWWNWINRVYQDHSVEASRKIKSAFDLLTEKLASNDTASLTSTLNLCTPVQPTNATSTALLTNLLTQVFSMSAELNYPVASPGRSPIDYPFYTLIDLALNTTDPLEFLAKAQWAWYKPMGAPCLDYEHTLQFLQTYGVPLINYNVWNYITCSYMHLSSSAYIASSPSSLFPARSVNHTQTTSLCHSTYNVTTLSKKEIETRYHFSPAEIQNSTHIIWSKGEYDPTSGVEPLELPLVADRDRSRTLFALDVAHREDLFRSGERDGQGVRKLRDVELEIFKGWLGV